MRPSREGLVFKAHRHVYHSTLGLRVIKNPIRSPPHSAAPLDLSGVPDEPASGWTDEPASFFGKGLGRRMSKSARI